ncbi:hypothetical protein [Labrys neptuniae]
MTTYPKSQVNITVDSRIYAGLQKLARAAGMTTTGYATQLFSAAYTARHQPTGDKALDEAVAKMSKPLALAPVPAKASEAKIEALTAEIVSLKAKLNELARKPITRTAPVDTSTETLRVEAARLQSRLQQQSAIIEDLREQVAATRSAPASALTPLPDTALARFLSCWSADAETNLRSAA